MYLSHVAERVGDPYQVTIAHILVLAFENLEVVKGLNNAVMATRYHGLYIQISYLAAVIRCGVRHGNMTDFCPSPIGAFSKGQD